MRSLRHIRSLRALKRVLGKRLYRVAVLYHNDGLSQCEVARKLHLSQATISRDVKRLAQIAPRVRAAGRLKAAMEMQDASLN